MEKIKIIEPCHEKWSEFTPTQQGAFCKKCAIDVIDFSSKSNDEIKAILVSNTKMCGRFTKTQLNDYNSDYTVWQNQSTSTFQSKFVFSLLLVFGLTLFSCTDTSKDSMVLGEMELFNNVNTLKGKLIPAAPTNKDSLSIDVDTLITSIEKTTEVPPQDSIIEPCIDTGIDHTDLIMGDVEYIDEEEDTHTKGKVAIDLQEKDERLMTLGMIAPPTPKVEVTEIDSSSTD